MAYLALAIAGLKSPDTQLPHAAYLSMELIGWCAIVPLSLAALVAGLVQSLDTDWGLFRHYWVVAKFALTSIGTTILLVHMRAVSRMAAFAREGSLSGHDHLMMRIQLVVHAVGGLLLLLTATVLSVYKPWGRIPFGKSRRE